MNKTAGHKMDTPRLTTKERRAFGALVTNDHRMLQTYCAKHEATHRRTRRRRVRTAWGRAMELQDLAAECPEVCGELLLWANRTSAAYLRSRRDPAVLEAAMREVPRLLDRYVMRNLLITTSMGT